MVFRVFLVVHKTLCTAKSISVVLFRMTSQTQLRYRFPETPSRRDKRITVCTEDVFALHPIGVDDIPELRTM